MTRNPVQVSSLKNHESNLPVLATVAFEDNQTLRNHFQGTRGWAKAAVARRLIPGNIRSWTLALAALLAVTGASAQAVFGTIPVGGANPLTEQTVPVTSPLGGTVSSVKVLTLGASGPQLDFQAGNTPSCVSTTPLATNGVCQQSVTFSPTTPGLRIGAVVLLDTNGAVLGTTFLSGTGLGGLGVLVPGNVLPVAGQDGYYQGALGDGQVATAAELYLPTSVTVDGEGNLYIADSQHNRVRMVCASSNAANAVIKNTYAHCTGSGIIVTIAGSGNAAHTGDNGAASASSLNNPSGVALDGAGNLYIADTGNSVIRVISAATGVITTIAGNGTPCAGSIGDSCAATDAVLNGPTGVTLDKTGNLYIADTYNQRIRKVTASGGTVTASSIITTVAGNGNPSPNGDGTGTFSGDNGPAISAGLSLPRTVAFDATGNMYIPDSTNNRVRKVTAVSGVILPASVITTFAGTANLGYMGDGGLATQAELWAPSGVAVDAAGNLFIADTQNAAIRKVSSASSATPGIISTLVASANGIFYFNSAFSKMAFYGPTGLYLDGSGNLYVADTIDMVVRKIQGNFVALQYPTVVRQGNVSAAQAQTIENDGNAVFDLTSIVPATNAAVNDSGITDPCDAPGTLAVSADCAIGAVFAPAKTPALTGNQAETPTIAVAGDSQTGVVQSSSPLNILLVGTASPVNGTTVVVTSNNNPSGFGQSVTFTATVTTGAGTGNLTGTVTFFDGTTTLQAKVPLNAPGITATATFATTQLTVGTHLITASYNGDATHFASLSTDPNDTTPPLTQNVQEGTATALLSSQNSSAVGQNVVFTATVSIFGGGGVTPVGSVTFFDGTNALNTVVLSTVGATGVASFSTAALAQGSHSITANYSQGVSAPTVAEFVSSTSNTVTQWVQTSSSIAVGSSLNPSIYGNPVTFTATITPSGSVPATGAVKFFDGAQLIGTGNLVDTTNQATLTISTLNVTTHPITATYAGDANNGASASLPYSQTVNKTQTSTTVAASPTPNGIAGGSVTISATVKVIAGSATTTGQVIFTSGATNLGHANLNASGTASITLTDVSPTTYSIVATYQGDSNDDGSTSTPAFAYTVVQATTQTTVTATPNPALVQAAVTFTAKVTGNGGIPTGSVIFSANGTQIGTAASLDATGTATLTYSGLAADSYTITAVYSGDGDDQANIGTSAVQLVIGKIPTTTDLGSSATTGSTPQVILVAAVLPDNSPVPTGTVTFNNGATQVGSAQLNSSGLATLTPNLPLGTYSIVAVYSGDALHKPSTSQPVTVSGTAVGFNLAVTPASVTMATKQSATVKVTLTSIIGFSDSIGLGCASLPPGVTCHFSSDKAALSANAITTVQLTIDTNNPLSGGTSAMNAQTGNHRTYLAGLLLPFSLFFGWLFWRLRKQRRATFIMVLLLALSGAAMLVTGCGGFTSSSAAPGTYVIQVTGTGVNSNLIHYQNVTLTIK